MMVCGCQKRSDPGGFHGNREVPEQQLIGKGSTPEARDRVSAIERALVRDGTSVESPCYCLDLTLTGATRSEL